MRVLVMLPTYNEIENIQDVLERARRRAARRRHPRHRRRQSRRHRRPGREARRRRSAASTCCAARQKSGLGSAYRAGFRVGPRARLRRHDRDGRRPLARPGGAARPRGRGRARAPTSPSARATCRAARSPTGSGCAALISRGGSLYAAHHARPLGARRHRRLPRLPPPTTSRRIDLDHVRADGYGFQVEMTYLTERNRRPHRRGADHVPRPQPGPLEDVGPHRGGGASLLVTWWAVRDRLPAAPDGVSRARH